MYNKSFNIFIIDLFYLTLLPIEINVFFNLYYHI